MNRPACMDELEYAEWLFWNARAEANSRAESPCWDCLTGFALEMRAAGTCDGIPLGYQEDGNHTLPANVLRSAEVRHAKMLSRASVALALKDAGLSQVRIAQLMGVSATSVSKYIRALG